eukprot:2647751-Pyramimonas_sp.AAC.1
MLSFAHARDVFFMVEQPNSSMFFLHAAVDAALSACAAFRVHTCMGGFGAPTTKPTELMTSIPASRLHLLAKTSSDALALAGRKRTSLFVKQAIRKAPRSASKWNKKSWITGNSGIKASQVYPLRFCQTVAELIVELSSGSI